MKPTYPLLAIIGLLLFLLIRSCATEPTHIKSNADSLRFVYEIQKKQFGHEQSILMNEIEQLNRSYQAERNAKDSIRRIEMKLTATNKELINKLRQTAPKDCDTLFNLYEEIIAAKEESYQSLSAAINLCDSASVAKDGLIASLQSEKKVDSTMVSELRKEIATFPKQLKKARNKGRLEGGMFVQFLNSIKNSLFDK